MRERKKSIRNVASHLAFLSLLLWTCPGCSRDSATDSSKGQVGEEQHGHTEADPHEAHGQHEGHGAEERQAHRPDQPDVLAHRPKPGRDEVPAGELRLHRPDLRLLAGFVDTSGGSGTAECEASEAPGQ